MRKNWNNYTDNGINNYPFCDIIWNDWENKYTEFTKYIFYPILKNFAMGDNIGRIEPYEKRYYVRQQNEETRILKCLDNHDRKHRVIQENETTLILSSDLDKHHRKHFVIQENETTLILKGLDYHDRKHVHLLCDKIGLHHKSVQKKKNKHLWIYKPVVWLWEYTGKNPYSESDEKKKLREQKQIQQRQLFKMKMQRKYCDGCMVTGWDTQLYCSVYVRELYCDDCLETLSDGGGGGGKLGDHKFEPI